MLQSYFFYGLLPILVYALVDAFSHNLRVAVVMSVLASFAELLLLYSKTGTVDPVSIVGTSLFIGLGYYSLRTNDRLFFKLQPAITAAIVGLLVGYLQFFGQPVLDRYWPFLQKILAPEQQDMLRDPQIHAMLNKMFTGLTFVMFLYAAWIAYAAKKQSQRAWVLVNVLGIFLLLFFLVVGVVIKALFTGAPEAKPFALSSPHVVAGPAPYQRD